MSKQTKLKVLLLAVSKPEAIGGQAACARMLLNHFDDVNLESISFPLPKQYGSFLRLFSSIKILLQALWICFTKKIDVVHILTACGRAALFEKLIIARVLKFTGVKVIINFQGAFDFYYAGFSRQDQYRIKKFLRKIDVVLCLHADIAKFLTVEKIVSPEKIKVIPNAVEVLPELKHIPDPEGKIRLLYLGWLITNKGLFTLVEAISILHKKYQQENFVLDIIGPEMEAGIISALKKEAAKINVKSLIRILNPVFGEAKRKVFASTNIFVFPTRMEGFPFVLLEAMEAGLCVVTTDISPMNLIVQKNQNGMLFQKDNAEDLAEKILTLMKNAGLRTAIGENARLHIVNNYSVDKIISEYRNLYFDVQKSLR